MPTYNYKCNECKIEFSVFKGINDEGKNKCHQCKTSDNVERVITGGTGMIFKGDGFYITDYVKTKNKKEKTIKDNKGNKNEQN